MVLTSNNENVDIETYKMSLQGHAIMESKYLFVVLITSLHILTHFLFYAFRFPLIVPSSAAVYIAPLLSFSIKFRLLAGLF